VLVATLSVVEAIAGDVVAVTIAGSVELAAVAVMAVVDASSEAPD
jgi:hypothetical protein